MTFYTHISDQFGPYYTKVIAATASEAPHVLDGLLYHQTGLQIEEHYTDTGGATDHVFGLCHLFGFRFAPRIRDLKDRRLYLFPGQKVQPILHPLVGGFADARHIPAHWDDLLRLATSIRSGTANRSPAQFEHHWLCSQREGCSGGGSLGGETCLTKQVGSSRPGCKQLAGVVHAAGNNPLQSPKGFQCSSQTINLN